MTVGSSLLIVAFQAALVPAMAASTQPKAPPRSAPSLAHPIERTSEPLSVVNSLPPPLTLNEVKRLKSAAVKSDARFGPVGFLSQLPPASPADRAANAPKAAAEIEPPAPRPAAPLILPARTNERPAFLERLRTPTPPPVRILPDRLVLQGDRELRCRIVGEMNGTIRAELENGTTLDFPPERIKQVIRRAQRP